MLAQMFSSFDWIYSPFTLIDLKEQSIVILVSFLALHWDMQLYNAYEETVWWVNRNWGSGKEKDYLTKDLHYERGAQDWI